MLSGRTNLVLIFVCVVVRDIICPYPPEGDDVEPGSVLVPASRRGRYLANVVRRQAVDGTGIKFNKHADRLNADSKRKVDVLSEELLPYIIAEQERRTTLQRRVMTAIQNGEKGVTIAEIRNKPPVIIRRGTFYRCPSNRIPKEPDGSGLPTCEEGSQPKQILYESCLSAEDKELYNADGVMFFCNRHKTEGPDLPRNGSHVIGCAPMERTSLSYTLQRCAVEETDDVVVHYRYYPDRTYKFVTDIDPDREVCDHWNPCQVGYIFSLPSTDQATPTTELWQDSLDEFVGGNQKEYKTSARRIGFPTRPSRRAEGGVEKAEFTGVKFQNMWGQMKNVDETFFTVNPFENMASIAMLFPLFQAMFFGFYFAMFRFSNGETVKQPLVSIKPAVAEVEMINATAILGQKGVSFEIPFKCDGCKIKTFMVRDRNEKVTTIEATWYMLKDGMHKKPLFSVTLGTVEPSYFGDYYVIYTNNKGAEERTKVLTLTEPDKIMGLQHVYRFTGNMQSAQSLRSDTQRNADAVVIEVRCEDHEGWGNSDCIVNEIFCNGENVKGKGVVDTYAPDDADDRWGDPPLGFFMFKFLFKKEHVDAHSCVYIAVFKKNRKTYKRIIGIIDTSLYGRAIEVKAPLVKPPPVGQPLKQQIPFRCKNCKVVAVTANGYTLPSTAYSVTSNAISLNVPYDPTYEVVFQAIFDVEGQNVTTNILEVEGAVVPGWAEGKWPDGEKPCADDGPVSTHNGLPMSTPDGQPISEEPKHEAADEEPEAEGKSAAEEISNATTKINMD